MNLCKCELFIEENGEMNWDISTIFLGYSENQIAESLHIINPISLPLWGGRNPVDKGGRVSLHQERGETRDGVADTLHLCQSALQRASASGQIWAEIQNCEI